MVLGDIDRVGKTRCRVPFWFPREGGTVHADLPRNFCFRCSQMQLMFDNETLIACDVCVRHDGGGGRKSVRNADDLTPP